MWRLKNNLFLVFFILRDVLIGTAILRGRERYPWSPEERWVKVGAEIPLVYKAQGNPDTAWNFYWRVPGIPFYIPSNPL